MANENPIHGGLFRHRHRKPRPTANDLALAKLSNALIQANLVLHRHLDPELWIEDGEADDLALLCEVDELLGVALLDLFDDDAGPYLTKSQIGDDADESAAQRRLKNNGGGHRPRRAKG